MSAAVSASPIVWGADEPNVGHPAHDESPTAWRVLVHLSDGRTLVHEYDTHAAASASLDGLADLPGFDGATVRHPRGFTPAPHRRLSIYGETRADRARRDLEDSWRFGQWLTSQQGDRFLNLVQEIDGDEDPYDVSLADARAVVERACDADDDEDGYFEDVSAQFDQALSEWLTKELRALGLKREPHRCAVAIPPVTPWPTSGGVYFVLAGDRLKIGKAVNVRKRLESLQTASPFALQLLAIAAGGYAEESALHKRFADLRIVGEWFRFDGDLVRHVADLRVQQTPAVPS